jgi:hypothetical protein
MIALLATKRSQEQHRENARFEESLAPRPTDSLTVTVWAASGHGSDILLENVSYKTIVRHWLLPWLSDLAHFRGKSWTSEKVS